jgi:hypothetical protein
MRTHVVRPDARRPQHAVGEIVWANVGNYAEDRDCNAKARPAVILSTGNCQHWVAGLTTKRSFKTTGDARVPVPVHCTRDESFLWSPFPSRLCRLDVRSHIGWIEHDAIDVMEQHMRLPKFVVWQLRAAADAHTNTSGDGPSGNPE